VATVWACLIRFSYFPGALLTLDSHPLAIRQLYSVISLNTAASGGILHLPKTKYRAILPPKGSTAYDQIIRKREGCLHKQENRNAEKTGFTFFALIPADCYFLFTSAE
jgi:hypothetical protein